MNGADLVRQGAENRSNPTSRPFSLHGSPWNARGGPLTGLAALGLSRDIEISELEAVLNSRANYGGALVHAQRHEDNQLSEFLR
jgi:hypothetical protein